MMHKNRFIPVTFLFFSLIIYTGLDAQVDTTGISKLLTMDLDDLMNQKIITASKYEQKRGEAASSIGVITSSRIKQYGYRTIAEVLNSIKGFFLSDDKNYIYTGVRGFSRPTDYNNRIVVMLNGHIMNEVVYGSAFMGNELGISLDDIDRIEIIKGPGASVYGSGSMLSTINLITKKGADINGIRVSAGAGSFGTADLSAGYGKKIGSADLFISAKGGTSRGENYYFPELDIASNNNGISKGNDWEHYAGMYGSLTKGNINISGGYSSRSKGIPTGAFETMLTGNVKSLDNRFYTEASYSHDINTKSRLKIRLYYDDYYYTGSYPSLTRDSFDSSTGKWAGGEFQYYLEAGDRNVITAGVEYKYIFRSDYHEWDSDTTYFNKNFPFSFYSVYAQDQFRIAKNLNLTAGMRWDSYTRFGNAFSPRLALVYRYNDNSSLKLLYGEAFRVPTLYEAYYTSFDAHKVNPKIKSEKIHALELVWLHKLSGNLSGNFSLYRFTMRNLIDQITDPSDDLTQFRNIGEARGTGAEYEFRFKNESGKTDGFINFTLQKTIDAATDKTLSNSPSFLIKSGVSLLAFNRFTISPEVFFETGRKTLEGNRTNNVCIFNINIVTQQFLRHLELSVKANNILNTKYYIPAGNEFIQDVLIQNSRSIYVKLTARF